MKIELRPDILELVREYDSRRAGYIVTNHDRDAELKDLIASKLSVYVIRKDGLKHYQQVLKQAKEQVNEL